jgi:Flp pilus assembly protein TadD
MKLLACSLVLFVLAPFCFAGQSSASAPSTQPHGGELQAARQLIDEGKLDEAISELSELQKQMPEANGVEHELGTAYYKKGDFAQAEAAFGRAM